MNFVPGKLVEISKTPYFAMLKEEIITFLVGATKTI